MKILYLIVTFFFCAALCACNTQSIPDTTSPDTTSPESTPVLAETDPVLTQTPAETQPSLFDNGESDNGDPFATFPSYFPAIDLPVDEFEDEGIPMVPVTTADPDETTIPEQTEPITEPAYTIQDPNQLPVEILPDF